MTTEHVALAIMHGSEPAVEEAGTNRKTGKTNFVPVESVDERRKKKMDLLSTILPKTLGSFKVAGIAEVKAHKKSSHVYLKLVDDAGLEPIKKIVETKENSALYDGALTELEQKNGLTKGVPKIVLCLRSTYWAKPGAKVRIPSAKKTDVPARQVAPKASPAPKPQPKPGGKGGPKAQASVPGGKGAPVAALAPKA